MTEPENTPLPWERQVGETDRQFEAFAVFRDMGPSRRHGAVAEKVGTSLQQVHRWSSDNRWAERASAWDDHRDEVKRRAELDELAEMAKRHVRLGVAMTQGVLDALEKRSKSGRPLPSSVLAQLAKHGVAIERLGRGLPSDHTRADVVDDREDEAFEALLEDPRTRSLLVAAATRPTPVEGPPDPDGGAS